jgi:hypothetical protein
MFAVDTNVVVRYLVNDNAAQAARARRLVEREDIFVPLTVLLETEWVLRGFTDSRRPMWFAPCAALPDWRASRSKMLLWQRSRWIGRKMVSISPMRFIWPQRNRMKRSSVLTGRW